MQRKGKQPAAPVNQNAAAVNENVDAPVNENIAEPAPAAPVIQPAPDTLDVTQSAPVLEDVAATQPNVDATNEVLASQDLFDEISDEVMASVPEVLASEPSQKKLKTVKLEKVKVVKKKSVNLYHGKQRRSSERIKMNSLSKPITGEGSSQKQPIVIEEVVESENAKLGTCVRAMKSWKNLTNKT
jgi:hypothetical protein